jgi:hypothetical protein
MSLNLKDLNDIQVPNDFQASFRLSTSDITISVVLWRDKTVQRVATTYLRKEIEWSYLGLDIQAEIDKLVTEIIEAQGEPVESPSNQNPETLEDSKHHQEDV